VEEFFDLSQPLESGMTIFPGDPEIHLQMAQGVVEPWRVTALQLGTHSGTHIDAGSHYYPQGKTIDAYPINRFIVPGVVIEIPSLSEDQAILVDDCREGLKNLPRGGAVLIRTDWSQFWNTERYLRHPHLSVEAASLLAGNMASLVGIDALNVDSTVQGTDQVHQLLLGQEILIVENLARLAQLQPGKIYRFSFLPLRWKGLDGSPIRAVAW
jgi:arylformamidase